MSFSYYNVVSDPGTEEAIQLDENKYIVKRELDDDESNWELKAKIIEQVKSWKLEYKIVKDKFHFYVNGYRSIQLKPENAVVDGKTIIGVVFHEQYFDLSQVNESVEPLYVPPEFLDAEFCYAVFAKSVKLISSGTFSWDGYVDDSTVFEKNGEPLGGDVVFPDWITRIGPCTFSDNDKITSVHIPGNIKEVGCYAFRKCSSLKKVVIDEGVERVYYDAFEDCPALEIIECPVSVKFVGSYVELPLSKELISDYKDGIFYSDNKIMKRDDTCTDVELISGITSIPDSFFEDCSTLKSIVIPEGITSIACKTFMNCSNLKSVTFPSTLTEIGRDAFCNCTALETIELKGESVRIGESAFEGCSGLKSVVFGVGSGVINERAFADCVSLIHLQLNGVSEIKNEAFVNNTALEELIVPGSVKRIGDSAFENCTSLRKAEIQDGVEYLGFNAFMNCTLLTQFICSQNVYCARVPIYNTAFINAKENYLNGVLYLGINIIACDRECTDIIIKDGVKEIPNGAFAGHKKLKSVFLPDSVTSIGLWAFNDCENLETVVLSNNLKRIVSGAFENCISLQNIDFPEPLSMIDGGAFKNCTALENVTFKDKPTEELPRRFFYPDPFKGCTALSEESRGAIDNHTIN